MAMRARDDSPKEFMGGNCAIIPRYQRAYSWDVVRGHSLVQDIVRAAMRLDGDPDHWIGVLLYETLRDPELQCDEGKNDPNNHFCREIVDGQQRLTTLALWHLALHAHAESIGEELDGDDEYPLPTLLLQKPNDKQLDRIKGGASVEAEENLMYRVYTYFRLVLWLGTDTILADEHCKPLRTNAKGTSLEEKFQGHFDASQKAETPLQRSAPVELATLLEATWDRLKLLVVETGENTEESSAIYDTLNADRTELTQFEHLRNYVFRSIPREQTDELFDDYWDPAQLKLVGESDPPSFLYEYLISIGESSKSGFGVRATFPAFRRYMKSARWPYEGPERWVTEHFQDAVTRFNYSKRPVGAFEQSGRDIPIRLLEKRTLHRISRVSTAARPLLMNLLDRLSAEDSSERSISYEEFQECLTLVEAILLFEPITGDKLTFVRPWLIRFVPTLEETCLTDGDGTAGHKIIQLLLEKRPEWRRIYEYLDNGWRNTDNEGLYDLLKPVSTLALLDALEAEESGGHSIDLLDRQREHEKDQFSVEHIFPQNDKRWEPNRTGAEMQRLRMHKEQLGNLAPLPRDVNSSINNAPFDDKREKLKDTELPRLRLNDWIDDTETWLDTEIIERTGELLKVAEKRWFDS